MDSSIDHAMDTLPTTNLETKEIVRPLANFSPSIWGDLFDSFTTDNQIVETYNNEVEGLKEKVRFMLLSSTSSCHEKLNLVDVIERLGLSYHFSDEIEDQLQIIFSNKLENNGNGTDLSTVALQFRLLRQHGFTVSSGKFMFMP